MVSIPTRAPDVIVQGTTLRFRKTFSDYSPDDAWSLLYTWVSKSGTFSATGVDNGDGGWLVERTALEMADVEPDIYEWTAIVSGGPGGSDRFQVSTGTTIVELDLASAPAPVDTRSYAKQLLDAVEATLLGRATSDQASYSIGGTSVAKMPIADLYDARDRLKAEVSREEAEERRRRGLGHRSRINVTL